MVHVDDVHVKPIRKTFGWQTMAPTCPKGWLTSAIHFSCPQLQLFVCLVCSRPPIAYSVDPEAQEKIQKRAERFKSSLTPQRSTASSILNTIHSLVRITSKSFSAMFYCVVLFVLSMKFLMNFFLQSFGEDGEEMDWSKYHVVGTCEDLEKPYLRLTSVSSTRRRHSVNPPTE